MDDLLELIADYPIALLAIIYLIARLLGGKRKPGATAGKEQTVEIIDPQTAPSRTPRQVDVERRLAEQLRAFGIEIPATSGGVEAPQPAGPGRADTEFHDIGAEEGDESAVDEEKKSAGAFSFHQAIQEPEEKEYHMQGFGFHEAHGLNVSLARAADDTSSEQGETTEGIPRDRDSLRQALVIGEVLGPPLALRRLRGRGSRII